jgi:hypothetical protein
MPPNTKGGKTTQGQRIGVKSVVRHLFNTRRYRRQNLENVPPKGDFVRAGETNPLCADRAREPLKGGLKFRALAYNFHKGK